MKNRTQEPRTENEISPDELAPKELESIHGGGVRDLEATFYTEFASNSNINEK
jgi:hypothetical protein